MTKRKEIFLTEEGLEDIKIELEELKNVRRVEVIESLKEARALGDLSENAEYDAARNEQAEIEGRIQEIEKMLENPIIIKEVESDYVTIGCKVKIEYVADKEVEVYAIVGTKEADPFTNKISNESPIATAIMGKKVGAVATVESNAGKYEVKIIEIL